MLDRDVFLERALLSEGLVSDAQLEEARRHAASAGIGFDEALVATQALTARQVALVRADICEAPYVDLTAFQPNHHNTSLVPRSVAQQHNVFPLFQMEGVLTLAMDDPMNIKAADVVRQLVNCQVDVVLAEAEQIKVLIAKAYSLARGIEHSTDRPKEERSEESGEVAPIVAAVNEILGGAVGEGASDVHINPDEHELHLRYRVDGVLQQRQGPPLSMHSGIVQRLKVMANLDLTQTRRPQDGKFRFEHDDGVTDCRFSTLPTIYGENVVIRLLARAHQFKGFNDLGMPADVVGHMDDAIRQPHGILLVTGPTGSGKTTTLYTALAKLNEPSRNIMTIEDPVEIRLPYLRQVQVNHEIGLTFASALRSILRQDPDVVLVGEIRDTETATIANQAALTGHLVLSTLHTNDAPGAVARLRDYGLPPFLINSTVLGVMAQRLARRVCDRCAAHTPLEESTARRFGLSVDDDRFVVGAGCSRCGQSGYRGRIGLYEFLHFNDGVKAAVERGDSTQAIRRLAISEGMRLMWQDGLSKAMQRQTTLEEVAKVAAIDLQAAADAPSVAEAA